MRSLLAAAGRDDGQHLARLTPGDEEPRQAALVPHLEAEKAERDDAKAARRARAKVGWSEPAWRATGATRGYSGARMHAPLSATASAALRVPRREVTPLSLQRTRGAPT